MTPTSSVEESTTYNELLKLPKWINEDYFLPILQKDEPSFKHRTKFIAKAATAPGENYSSIMFRIVVDFQLNDDSTKQTSYILKSSLEAPSDRTTLINSMNLFPKEKKMYEAILPGLEKLYKDADVYVKIAPSCIQIGETSESITLVLEDLKRRGYKNMDRLKGLDLPHMRAALRKLAEFHAASAMYYVLNGPYDQIFHRTRSNNDTKKMFEAVSESNETAYKKAFLQWGLDDAEYYLAKYVKNDQFVNTADPNGFNVLNHGDVWPNNIMFNYTENGEIDKTIFVDFQMCEWGSPTRDLWYLITTSPSLDIKIREFDNFIYIYHKYLIECLKLLNYPKTIPSLKELHIMMLNYGSWALFTAYGALVVVMMPADTDVNMELFLKVGPEADAARYKMFTNRYYAKAMTQLLPFLDKKGILDIIREP